MSQRHQGLYRGAKLGKFLRDSLIYRDIIKCLIQLKNNRQSLAPQSKPLVKTISKKSRLLIVDICSSFLYCVLLLLIHSANKSLHYVVLCCIVMYCNIVFYGGIRNYLPLKKNTCHWVWDIFEMRGWECPHFYFFYLILHFSKWT